MRPAAHPADRAAGDGQLPATAPAYAAAVLERTEKRVTQKGLGIGQQGIPFGGIEFGEALYGLDRHGRSLACRAAEKAGLKWSITDERDV